MKEKTEFKVHQIEVLNTRSATTGTAKVVIELGAESKEFEVSIDKNSQKISIKLCGVRKYGFYSEENKEIEDPTLLEAIKDSIDWNAVAGWVVVNMVAYLRMLF